MAGFRLELKLFEARFRQRFNHASASRAKAASVVCIALGDDGVIGHGEGCPRDYVTGETTVSVLEAFQRWKPEIERDIRDLSTLRRWVDVNRDAIDADPAAFAAIETALLDLFAKREGQPLEAFLGIPTSASVTVTAVFGVAGAVTSGLLAAGYRAFGTTDAKVKLSPDPAADRRRMHIIARLLGPKARLRVDANNLFDDVERCAHHLQAIDLPVWAIEEPFRPRDAPAQRRLAAKADIRVILDESAIHPGDHDGLEGDGWVVNLRVSKQGGLLRSIEMAELARARGLDVIIGSHVGETSLLARSALVLAAACSDLVIAAEAVTGAFCCSEIWAHPSLRFGKRGILAAQREGIAGRSGLGVTVDQEILNSPKGVSLSHTLPPVIALGDGKPKTSRPWGTSGRWG